MVSVPCAIKLELKWKSKWVHGKAHAIILLETFAVYLMVMTSIHTDILAMRLERLGEQTMEIDEMNDTEKNRQYNLLLIDCFKLYSMNTR